MVFVYFKIMDNNVVEECINMFMVEKVKVD